MSNINYSISKYVSSINYIRTWMKAGGVWYLITFDHLSCMKIRHQSRNASWVNGCLDQINLLHQSRNAQWRETNYYCNTCIEKPALHAAPCFHRYHTMLDYKSCWNNIFNKYSYNIFLFACYHISFIIFPIWVYRFWRYFNYKRKLWIF